MTRGQRAKLERLIARLVESESAGLSDGGRKFLGQRLRYRFGMRDARPVLSGANSAERRYVEHVIGVREAKLLAADGVADEVEAAGGEIRL